MSQSEAFAAGYRAALDAVELQDAERARMGRALTDAEVRRLADYWLNPIRVVSVMPRPDDDA